MGANSKIEWTDHTFNPWIGCTKISPACDHCYAEVSTAARSTAARKGHALWGPGAPRSRTANWTGPLRWNKEAAAAGKRARVFCASLADVFDNEVDPAWRSDLFKIIEQTPHLDWLLLTKRIGNVMKLTRGVSAWPNVWLGATICNQEEADRDIPKLLATPAAVRFLSIEPMLGPIRLSEQWIEPPNCPDCGGGMEWQGEYMCPGWGDDGTRSNPPWPAIDWVIVGGESGPNARPMHPAWARSIRDQCERAGVPFLFKQWGEWLPTAVCSDDMAMLPSKRTVYVRKDGTFCGGVEGVNFFGGDEETAWVGKKAAGRLLDGRTHDGFPEVDHG